MGINSISGQFISECSYMRAALLSWAIITTGALTINH